MGVVLTDEETDRMLDDLVGSFGKSKKDVVRRSVGEYYANAKSTGWMPASEQAPKQI